MLLLVIKNHVCFSFYIEILPNILLFFRINRDIRQDNKKLQLHTYHLPNTRELPYIMYYGIIAMVYNSILIR